VAGGDPLLNLGIFRDQTWIGGLTIHKPEQFFHSQRFFRIPTIHEKFCFRFVRQHFVNLQKGLPIVYKMSIR